MPKFETFTDNSTITVNATVDTTLLPLYLATATTDPKLTIPLPTTDTNLDISEATNQQNKYHFFEPLLPEMETAAKKTKTIPVYLQEIVPSSLLALLYKSGQIDENLLPEEMRNKNSMQPYENRSAWSYTAQLAHLEQKMSELFSDENQKWYEKIAFRGGIALNWLIENSLLISQEAKSEIQIKKGKLKHLQEQSFFSIFIRNKSHNEIPEILYTTTTPEVLSIFNLSSDLDAELLERDFPQGINSSLDPDIRFQETKQGKKILFIKGPFEGVRQFGGSTGPTVEIIKTEDAYRSRGTLNSGKLQFKPSGEVVIYNAPEIRNGRFVQTVNFYPEKGFKNREAAASTILDLSKAICYSTINAVQEFQLTNEPPKENFRTTLEKLINEADQIKTRIAKKEVDINSPEYSTQLKSLEKRNKEITKAFIEIYKSAYIDPENTFRFMSTAGMISEESIPQFLADYNNEQFSPDQKFYKLLTGIVGEKNIDHYIRNLYYLNPSVFNEMLYLQNSQNQAKDQNGNLIKETQPIGHTDIRLSGSLELEYLADMMFLEELLPFPGVTITERINQTHDIHRWDKYQQFKKDERERVAAKYPEMVAGYK